MRFFTADEDKFLRDNHLNIPTKRMAKLLGRSEGTARQRLKILGIKVPPDIIQKFKNESRFKPGNISFNKGKRQSDYMSHDAMERTVNTRFKKGDLPTNTKRDLYISVRADKRGVKYQFIRISQANWIGLHRFVWEMKHGPIAKGFNIIFKDGNTLNSNLENLQLLSNADLLRRNSLHNYPKELAVIIQLRGALTRQINKHLKKLSDEKQNR